MKKFRNEFQFQHRLELASLLLILAFVIVFTFTFLDVLDIVKSNAYPNLALAFSF